MCIAVWLSRLSDGFLPLRSRVKVLVPNAVSSYKSKYEKVGVLPIQILKSNVSSVGASSERNRNCPEGQRSKR